MEDIKTKTCPYCNVEMVVTEKHDCKVKSLQKELEAVKDDADTWRRVSESLQLDVKSLKELAINAANQLELYHPESDIPDQLEELL